MNFIVNLKITHFERSFEVVWKMFYHSDFEKPTDSVENLKNKNYRLYLEQQNRRVHSRSHGNSSENSNVILDNEICEKSIILSYWRRYCEHSSIHGIKYISMSDLHWSER